MKLTVGQASCPSTGAASEHSSIQHKKGEFRGGESPSDGGLGVSPRFLKTSLGWVGGKNNAHVPATTPTLPIAHAASPRKAEGFIPQIAITPFNGGAQRGSIPLCRGSRGVPLILQNTPSRALKSSLERGYRGQSPLTGGLGGVPPDSETQAASRRRRRRATWPRRRGPSSAAC